jgi:glycosyltransferase involved in cell wall biosynthesis
MSPAPGSRDRFRLDEVVIALPGDPATRTGGTAYDARIVAELRARGRAASLLSLPDDFPFPSEASISFALARLAAVRRSAALIVDGLAFGALPAAGIAALGRPVAALVHHPLALETGLSAADAARLETSERAALAQARAVIATSERTGDILRTRFGVPTERLAIAPPGVDPQPRAEGGGASPVILTVATVTPRKNHAALAEALASLVDLDWRWRIIGPLDRDLACAADLRERIEASRMAERVELAGAVDDETLAAAYHAADIFALPSRFEGYGMAFAEALAHGLPVVACEGAAPALPSGSPAAVLVPMDDVPALARALRGLLEGADARRRASDAAWELAGSLPRWSEAADVVERVAASLTAGPRGFDPGWLDLREPADHAAWAEAPLARLLTLVGAREPIDVVDLGAGSGSTLRALAPRLGPRQRWTLIDNDAALLAHARRRLAEWADAAEDDDDLLLLRKGPLRIEARCAVHDLAREPVPSSAAAADLIVASALFDLVGAGWLERFLAGLQRARAPLYARLVYDGAFSFSPPHPADDAVVQAFSRHQGTDKGFGPALGPGAADALERSADSAGWRSTSGQSPWRLGPSDAPLIAALAEGAAQAAGETAAPPAGLEEWLAFRLAEAAGGAFVGHRDLFIEPR